MTKKSSRDKKCLYEYEKKIKAKEGTTFLDLVKSSVKDAKKK